MDFIKKSLRTYVTDNRKAVIFLTVCLAVILLSSFIASGIQSAGWSVEVSDLRNQTNSGTKTITQIDPDTDAAVQEEVKIAGKVVSGILFKPDKATKDNPLPAVVLTHGYLNNREMQLQNAIELARRGFVVLTIDREGHGNYENSGDTSALMATSGMYDSVKYLYNLDYVDKTKIGISGHSMGGMTTASVLMTDAANGYNLVSAGLMQAWSTFMGAGADVDVGFLKAYDDEFFFKTQEDGGTISREWLTTVQAKSFVGNAGMESSVVNGGIYVGGETVDTVGGQAVDGAFRVIYEVPGVHPQNHCSVPAAKAVVNFFYNSFGTPSGYEYISEGKQTWWVKEAFSFVGLIAFFAMVFPLVSLLLALPFFRTLSAGGTVAGEGGEITSSVGTAISPAPLKGARKHLSYWLAAIAITVFSGFSIQSICTEYGSQWFPNTQLYPQDTTNWVAMWAVAVALFSLAVILIFRFVNGVADKIKYGEQASLYTENPFAAAKISTGAKGLAKTALLAVLTVSLMLLVLFINWAAWMVDFRIWTLAIKVFNVGIMLPTILRYALFFGIFFAISAMFNENYRASNLPEWASILINIFFNIFGVLLVICIQYGQFRSTGVLWQADMALGYIVLIPMIPNLAVATLISRRMTAKTGNVWLGAFINTLLFTIITCTNTAASFAYVMG